MPQSESYKDIITRATSAPSSPTTGKNYLFVIAIDAYTNCPRLHNCVRDANALMEILYEKYLFDKAHTYTLFNEEATERNIFYTFRELAEKVTSQDNLLIYYSGHGEYDQVIDEGYWVPVDGHLGAQEDYIANGRIKTFLNAIPSHHTFLIVDSCFSGSLFTQFKNATVANRLEKDPSRWGLTAGRNEIVSDGKAGDNSPFADMLLYQLRNSTGPIGVASICNKVIENVIANADQTPRGEPLKIKGHRGGQFFFHPKNAAAIIPSDAMKSEEIIPKGLTQGTTSTPSQSKDAPLKFAILGLFLISMLGGLLYYFSRDTAPTEVVNTPQAPVDIPPKQIVEPSKRTSTESRAEQRTNKAPVRTEKPSPQIQHQSPIRQINEAKQAEKTSPQSQYQAPIEQIKEPEQSIVQQAPIEKIPKKPKLVKRSANGKYGLKDQNTGQWVLLPAYKNITAFSGGLAAVQDFNYKWGYVNTKGEIIIPFLIDQPSKFATSDWVGVMINAQMIQINKKGQVRMGKQLVSLAEFVNQNK